MQSIVWSVWWMCDGLNQESETKEGKKKPETGQRVKRETAKRTRTIQFFELGVSTTRNLFLSWRRCRRNYLTPSSSAKKNLHRLSLYIIRKKEARKNVFAYPVEYFHGCEPISAFDLFVSEFAVEMLRSNANFVEPAILRLPESCFLTNIVVSRRTWSEINRIVHPNDVWIKIKSFLRKACIFFM